VDVRPPKATTALQELQEPELRPLQERLRLLPELLHQRLELLARELSLPEQELAQAWRARVWSLPWKESSPSCP
jgi:hypothetical protein